MKQGFIIAAGLADLGFAAFHILFWRLFGWPESLQGSGRTNAATTQVLNIMLTYGFVAYAASLLWLGGNAPAPLLAAGAGFALLRLALQPLFYGLQHPLSRLMALAIFLAALLHLVPLFL